MHIDLPNHTHTPGHVVSLTSIPARGPCLSRSCVCGGGASIDAKQGTRETSSTVSIPFFLVRSSDEQPMSVGPSAKCRHYRRDSAPLLFAPERDRHHPAGSRSLSARRFKRRWRPGRRRCPC